MNFRKLIIRSVLVFKSAASIGSKPQSSNTLPLPGVILVIGIVQLILRIAVSVHLVSSPKFTNAWGTSAPFGVV